MTSVADKKKYYSLDDVGFLGVVKERSSAEIGQDARRTSEYIKNYGATSSGDVKKTIQPKRSSSTGTVMAKAFSKKKSTTKTK
jgi:hypothetical protein